MTFKLSAKKQLAKAQTAVADTQTKLADRHNRREAALLASDDTAPVIVLDNEIAELKRIENAQHDRVKVLQREAEREEGLARAKRRADQIARVKAEIAKADAVGIEAQALADQLVKLFRRECEMRLAIAAMWPWNNSDRGAIGLSGVAVKERYMRHFYKIGAAINPLGGLPVDRMMPSFPGGLSPRFDLRLQPDKLPSMADDMAERAAYAAKVLDGGKVAAAVLAAPAVGDNKLAALLKQQAALANDVTPEGEAAYQKVVEQITALSLEIATQPKSPDAAPDRPAA